MTESNEDRIAYLEKLIQAFKDVARDPSDLIRARGEIKWLREEVIERKQKEFEVKIGEAGLLIEVLVKELDRCPFCSRVRFDGHEESCRITRFFAKSGVITHPS